MSNTELSTSNVSKNSIFKNQYDNFIGGKWIPPIRGQYFDNTSPVDGQVFTKVARSSKEDIELAIDAAWTAVSTWAKSSADQRSNLLLKIADVMEKNLETLAQAETWDNGKAIREIRVIDIPLAIDHFRDFAGVVRVEAGRISPNELDSTGISLNIPDQVGVVGYTIPWNFPLLMATWKIAPALAAGNCIILKPAEQTPVSTLILMEMIQDILPAGVLNIINGIGLEAGKALDSSARINGKEQKSQT